MEQLTKQCTKCGEVKKVGEFNKATAQKSGYYPSCRECQKKLITDYRYSRLTITEVSEKECSKCGLKKPASEFNKSKHGSKDGLQTYCRSCESTRTGRKRNIKDLERIRVRRLSDLAFAIRDRLSARIRDVVKRGYKSARTKELTGCTPSFLRAHIASQFRDGMTWQNIHIDHALPCAAFDLSDAVNQRAVFNWRNLQPMFALDNISKGDKIPAELPLALLGWCSELTR